MRKVFISYSHDGPEHSRLVLALSTSLRERGIDVELDQYHVRPPAGWPRWCEEQLRPENAEFVLVICTDTYRRRVEGRVNAAEGRGVFWEGGIIYNYLCGEKGAERFVPILLTEAHEDHVPLPLRGYSHYRLTRFDFEDSGYVALYRELTGQASVMKTPLGTVVRLPATTPPLPTSPAALGDKAVRTMFPGHLQVVPVTDVDAQRDDLWGALQVYERLPEGQRFESTEFIELTRRHLSDEFGPRWKNYVLLAKSGATVVGLVVCYDDLEANLSFVSCLAARRPMRGEDNVDDISRELVLALMDMRARHGTPGRALRILTEVDNPGECEDVRDKTRCLSRLRLFGKIAGLEHVDLKCLDVRFVQPSMNLWRGVPGRHLLLVYAEHSLPNELPREAAVEILTWVYTELYGDDVYEQPAERAAYKAHTTGLLAQVLNGLPEQVALLTLREIGPKAVAPRA